MDLNVSFTKHLSCVVNINSLARKLPVHETYLCMFISDFSVNESLTGLAMTVGYKKEKYNFNITVKLRSNTNFHLVQWCIRNH